MDAGQSARPGPSGAPALSYLKAVLTSGAFLFLVGFLRAQAFNLPTAILLYLVPVILAASRWGRGPAITAVVVAVLGHNVLFVDPAGTLTVNRLEDALSLALLLFTALVTAQLADSARRGALAAHEALVARRSDELKTALLRAVSHELRTPLASIKASVSGLRQSDGAYSDEDRAELLAEIEEEADRLDRLVGNLLDASRLEAGALQPRTRPQDVAEAITATLRRLRPLLEGRKLELEIEEGLPLVACDYTHLGQALQNLVENAAVHSPPPGRILLRAARQGEFVRIEVADEGPGIAPADRERVFRAFERGPSRAPGSGLGLTIARGLIEANGGRLVLAEADRGARFVLTVPIWSPRT